MEDERREDSAKTEQGEVKRFFPGQRDPETILLEGRPSLMPLILAIAAIAALILVSGGTAFVYFSWNMLVLVMGIAWMICLLLLGGQCSVELIYRLNTKFVLTQKNLYAQSGVLRRRNRTLIVSRIQDVVVEQGPLGMAFKYGNVRVETAGERGELVLNDVPNPLGWRATILTVTAFATRGRDQTAYAG
jgi:uncharacterized membrane protein YdbT with pleckstrin-like domain